MNLLDLLRALYASEINCGVASMSGAGVKVWLGDHSSGIRAEREFRPDELDEAARWLADEARWEFPDSDFARGVAPERRTLQRALDAEWTPNSLIDE
jgi:hypothetical protein